MAHSKPLIASILLAMCGCLISTAQAQVPAKKLFGAKKLPAVLKPAVHGFYNKGCVQGAVAVPIDGPNHQAMRLSRNRRWGHPELVELVLRLAADGKKVGWNGLLVGDLSQPRGGPMLSGHASHQLGLDADVWLNPMPDKRYSRGQRERVSARSMLQRNGKGMFVDEKVWTEGHAGVIRTAASYSNVERVLVHPGIKKKLCDTVKGDRSWMSKVRPYWGHHYHMHIRIGCPAGSTNCRRQAAPPKGDGCGGALKWWFDVGLRPPKKTKRPAKPAKPKPQIRLKDLPRACRVVLSAAEPENELAATAKFVNNIAVLPKPTPAAAAANRVAAGTEADVPLPKFRPAGSCTGLC